MSHALTLPVVVVVVHAEMFTELCALGRSVELERWL